MSARRQVLSLLSFVAAMLWTSAVWACPYCVGKEKDELSSALIIVAMVSVPFTVVAVTSWLIRRVNQDAQGHDMSNTVSTASEVC